MAQTWHDLLFAHWPVDPAALRGLMPAGLDLDPFEGRAYVGVVPFRMSGIHLRGLPPLPGLSAFPEINLRTYVIRGARPGVFFLSLDATNPVAVWTARRFFRLPYFRARMACRNEGEGVAYESLRTHRGFPAVGFRGSYGPVGPPGEPRRGSLEHWLTERYCLYTTDARGRLAIGEILHDPWPLQPAEARIRHNDLADPFGLALGTPALLHFARRLEVRLWRLEEADAG
jgi:uncharacterized protein YqjF (DUF2071 family)